MLGLNRKTLKTSISDISKVKSEKTLFLLCSFFNMGFEFPDIRYNLAFYFHIKINLGNYFILFPILFYFHIKINTTLYNPEHITDASDSQDVRARTDPRYDVDSEMVNSFFAPFQNETFCRTPIFERP